jgi:hypothetical protein
MRVFPVLLIRAHTLEQLVTGGGANVEVEVTDSKSKAQLPLDFEERKDAPQQRDETLATESVRQMPNSVSAARTAAEFSDDGHDP